MALLLTHPIVRFGLVALLGLVIDLGTAWLLAFGGMPLPGAAAAGFVVAALVNYIVHERWTFRTEASLSAARGSRYFAVLIATLGVRVAVVAVLESAVFSAPQQRALPLLLAVAVSFFVNYGLSKRFVFTSDAH